MGSRLDDFGFSAVLPSRIELRQKFELLREKQSAEKELIQIRRSPTQRCAATLNDDKVIRPVRLADEMMRRLINFQVGSGIGYRISVTGKKQRRYVDLQREALYAGSNLLQR
jgi:hypothetical protein